MSRSSPAIEFLEEAGLASSESIRRRLEKMGAASIRRTAEGLYDAISRGARSPQTDVEDFSFRFLASASIRGDAGCRKCAWEKLDGLARHAALYADRLVLPVPVHLGCEKDDREHLKYSLSTQVHRIAMLRPLVDADLVELVPDHSCPEHAPFDKASEEAVRGVAQELLRENCRSFRLFVRPRRGGFHCLELNGPPEYLEHGSVVRVFEERPEWLPRYGAKADRELSHKLLHRSGFLGALFSGMVNDVVVHRIYGKKLGASYLTDLAGEARILSRSNEETGARAEHAVARQLAHQVPLFRNLSLATLVRIRREEPLAFKAYRDSLNDAIRRSDLARGGGSDKEVRTWFMDTMQPRIDELKRLASNSRVASLKSAAQYVVASATIAIGFAAAGQALLAATTSVGGAIQAARDVVDAVTTPKGIRNSDVFYLFRLDAEKQEGRT